MKKPFRGYFILAIAASLRLSRIDAGAYDISDKFSIAGIMAGAYQYQWLGDIFGAWLRFTWQDDKALINYTALSSGGINIRGRWYGREQDNIGIGYAFLNGKYDFDYTQVTEVYWRVVLNEYFAATADFQYMQDNYENSAEDIDGIIGGIRLAAEF